MGKSGRGESELLVPLRKRKSPDDDQAFNHVSKKQMKGQGLEVVFNPAKHRDFITGFRKRKLQRQKEAQKLIKSKEKRVRIESRAERRAALKEELGLGDNWGVSSDDDEPSRKPKAVAAAAPSAAPDAAPRVAVYEQQGTRTTVITAPLDLYPDSDQDKESEEEEEEAEGQAAQEGLDQLRNRQQQQQRRKQPAAAQNPRQHKGALQGRKKPGAIKPKKQGK